MCLFSRTSDPWSGVDDLSRLVQYRFDLLEGLGAIGNEQKLGYPQGVVPWGVATFVSSCLLEG